MKNILVTGGAGFIGSNFIPYYLEKHPDTHIVNLDKLTYAADLSYLTEVKDSPRYTFVEGDICDRDLIESLFNEYKFQGVIHFAAESHVDNSIEGPDIFIQTNIVGTFTLIDVAKNNWLNAPHDLKPDFKEARFHHVSTDEVYGSLGAEGYFTETTPYSPNSPYSASKASSDHIVRSYHETYGLNVTLSNCSNNFGPKQHQEKLIPTIIRNALKHSPIPIYGKGENIRDWLYVLDHCTAIDTIFNEGKAGETYNVGTNNEKNNIELTKEICAILDDIKPSEKKIKYETLITYVKDRPGHDLRYAIDFSKIKTQLKWTPQDNFLIKLKETILFYI